MKRIAFVVWVLASLLWWMHAVPQSKAASWLPLVASSGCSQATALLARTSGLSGTEQNAYISGGNTGTGICGLVNDGLGTYAALDGLWVFTTNNATTAGLNIISTSYTLAQNNFSGCTFTADRGIAGGGTCFWDTGFNPSTAGGHFTQNSAHIAGCVLNSRTTDDVWVEIGNTSGSISYIEPLVSNSGNKAFGDVNGSTFVNAVNTNAQGAWIASRTSSAVVTIYKAGSSFASSSSDTSQTLINSNIVILALGGSGDYTGDTLGWASIGGALSATQAASLTSNMSGIITAVGASGC